MTTASVIVERLVANAGAGRGLWVGLDIERSPRHELLRLELESTPNPTGRLRLTEDTHVTIAHLGRECGRREVEAAVTACHVLSRMLHVTSVSVEGLGRLRDHLVAVIAPRWIDDVVAHVERCLADSHVHADRSFVGIRHVSIGTVAGQNVTMMMPRISGYTLRMHELMTVCGDDRISFPLLAEKPSVF
jgi:2'-5' RNA ligase